MSENWYGWLRRNRRCKWQRVCGPCDSMPECSRQLGAEAKRLGIKDRNTCMTTGAIPRDVAATNESGSQAGRPSGNYLGGH
ncbi:MAG: hypothetical protein ACYC3I_02830 [Gemmataceae bacterium]